MIKLGRSACVGVPRGPLFGSHTSLIACLLKRHSRCSLIRRCPQLSVFSSRSMCLKDLTDCRTLELKNKLRPRLEPEIGQSSISVPSPKIFLRQEFRDTHARVKSFCDAKFAQAFDYAATLSTAFQFLRHHARRSRVAPQPQVCGSCPVYP